MSAILKTATIFSGVALTGAALYTNSQQQRDFSSTALKVSELDVPNKAAKARLPSEFFSFTVRDIRISNAA